MKVAVVGAGTMGAGIAQLSAMAGHSTELVDVAPAQLERAAAAVTKSLQRFVTKERITADEAAAATANIHPGSELAAAVAQADVVVETVIEVLDAKRDVFRTVAEAAPAQALLGTNTSQLSITAIAAAVPQAADRVIGLHFFNPAVMMRLVEVVSGLQTSDETIRRAVAFGEGLGKDTVVCRKDSPGFLTSRISAIVRIECLRMLEEGVASAADIDKAVKLAFNWPMGPLELGDFNGLDTYLDVLHGLEASLGARYKPTATLTNLVVAGRLGRKTGHGIYAYDADGNRVTAPAPGG